MIMDLILQTSIKDMEQYEPFFVTYDNISIEISDFAYPQNYGIQGEKIVDAWLNSAYVDRITGIHGSYFDLILHSIDPQIAEITRKRYLWNLGIADTLKADYCVFHTNFQTEHQSRTYIKNWLEVHNNFLDKYEETYTTQILLENLRDPSPHLLATLAKLVDCGFCLDVGHIQGYSVESFESWFKVLRKSIEILHLKDINKPGDELALGRGKIDWNLMSSLIQEFTPQGKLVLELSGMEQIEESIELLAKVDLI